MINFHSTQFKLLKIEFVSINGFPETVSKLGFNIQAFEVFLENIFTI